MGKTNDRKKCKLNLKEKKNGIKFKAEGKDCKRLLGKDMVLIMINNGKPVYMER